VRCILAAALAALATLVAWPAAAADAAAGRLRAQQTCAVCHGPLGVATAPETPNLAGEPAGYLARQLKAFRSGARQHEVMAVIARQLGDADIHNVAAWFSSIRVEARAPD
jgi:cytochrome c553